MADETESTIINNQTTFLQPFAFTDNVLFDVYQTLHHVYHVDSADPNFAFLVTISLAYIHC